MLTLRPWSLEALARLLFWILCGLAGVSLLAWGLDQALSGLGEEDRKFWTGVAGTCLFHGVVLGAILTFLRRERLTWNAAFGFGRTSWSRVLGLGAALAGGFFLLNLLLMPLASWLIESAGLDASPQDSIATLREAKGWLHPLLLGVLAVGIAPVMEELIFRGLLYPAIKQLGFPRLALWGTSVLFALSHANLLSLLPLILLGAALARLYEITDDLRAPIASHFVFNLINLVLALTLP